MTTLVTGAAGFIGFHVCQALLDRGETVVGVDNLNDYYDVVLKKARLKQLEGHSKFSFHKIDIADKEAVEKLGKQNKGIKKVIHLAAQAGVRYSLEHPYAYSESNLTGQLVILELCRHLPNLDHLIFASSSSVYGGNTKQPFAVGDVTDTPISLYAATKKAAELMGYAYSHLYKIPMTGLRFFTVYGPYGRPDMAYFSFTRDIINGKPIRVFNNGDMKRDFTYIDDVVSGVLAAAGKKPEGNFKAYNLGNNKPEKLMDMINILEDAIGKKAKFNMQPMQPGDVKETYADIDEAQKISGILTGL